MEEFIIKKLDEFHKNKIKLKIIGKKNFSQNLNMLLKNPEKKWCLAALLHDAPEYVIGDMISPVKTAIGSDYKSLENRLSSAINLRFGLPTEIPEKIKKQIKKADKISAWIEAIQIAGFTKNEADKLFGVVDNNNIDHFSIRLRPPLEVRESYILRFNELII